MNVGQLKLIINGLPDDAEITIYGCYGSQGDIEKAYVEIEEEKKLLIIESDICSG